VFGRQNADIADTMQLSDIAMTTNFVFIHMGCTLVHLANPTEPSVSGGDAALCHITLTTCYGRPM